MAIFVALSIRFPEEAAISVACTIAASVGIVVALLFLGLSVIAWFHIKYMGLYWNDCGTWSELWQRTRYSVKWRLEPRAKI